ncbi:MAG: choice-of-anchor J domain-containing protein, partial [Muribaculaceae bacterium]|nr:choice-of-anchor J domain-containing protein [Muribaculaceae bacterium]
WTLARIDLTPYKSAKYIQVGVMLRAIHNTDENIWSVPFDNLRVIDLKDEALRVSVAAIPDAVQAGEEFPVSLTVENIGRNALNAAQVAVSIDGVEFEPIAIENFTPGKVATAKTSVPTSILSPDAISVVAQAMTDAETVATSVEKDVTVKFPALPMPENFYLVLAGSLPNYLGFMWDAPDYTELTKPTEVFEDFENPDYEPFTYSDFAGFQFVDMDGKNNYNFLKDVNNPYQSWPMAYQLFNPELAGVPEDYLADCPTHSGKSMLVAWSNDGQNANLLISPELTGEEQTVSFWGRGFTVASGMHETFSVWVSDTDTQVKSFTQLHEVENYPESGIVPEEWTEFKFTVPAGTKYFGILHDAYDSYALFLDDFTFKTAGVLPADTELTGYNFYYNGELHQECSDGHLMQSASHVPEEDGIYEYRVSAVYNHGESRATEPIEVDFHRTSIAEIEGTGITLECNDQVLTVTAPEGTTISVIDITGRVIASGKSTLTTAVPANSVVLVSAGTNIFKVAVK